LVGEGGGRRTGLGLGLQRTYDRGQLMPPYCYLTVVVDGVKIYQFGDDRDPPDVASIMARELQAVEVYRGPSEIPPDLNATGSECGVLVLWTRTGEEPKP
jgi:hypothetical protein